MTVPKLKAALTELGLATDGDKPVLVERLAGARISARPQLDDYGIDGASGLELGNPRGD